MSEPRKINGKHYPMWQSLVDGKAQFIGCTLESFEGGQVHTTKVKDLILRPNGDEHAWFEAVGEDFGCGFCTSVGGLNAKDDGYLNFYGYQHEWRIKLPVAEQKRKAGDNL